jgi:hypothetical protein
MLPSEYLGGNLKTVVSKACVCENFEPNKPVKKARNAKPACRTGRHQGLASLDLLLPNGKMSIFVPEILSLKGEREPTCLTAGRRR